MNLHSKISTFLFDRLPEPYCDDCIAEETASDPAEVRDETVSMRMRLGFLSGGALCTQCGDTKLFTTKAAPLPAQPTI
jgi:hypothetical protein